MAATVNKVQLASFFHTHRELQTRPRPEISINPCFD
jgi:hypothetical protein